MNKSGFSLLEVLIAVTLTALLASSALGLIGYHTAIAAKVEKRFLLFNRAAALLSDIPFIIKETDEDFPFLEKNEKKRDYEGEYKSFQWKARLTKMHTSGIPEYFKLAIKVSIDDQEAELFKYLLNKKESKEKNQDDN